MEYQHSSFPHCLTLYKTICSTIAPYSTAPPPISLEDTPKRAVLHDVLSQGDFITKLSGTVGYSVEGPRGDKGTLVRALSLPRTYPSAPRGEWGGVR